MLRCVYIKDSGRSTLDHNQTMAEIAAGAVVAEQIVSTTIEGGVIAGYAVAKPTVPLKASFSQIASADKDDATYLTTHSTSSV
jgi:hypothetical protein